MSLLGQLESLDYSKNEVDLFVFSHRGELMDRIPPEVKLLPEIREYAQIERPIKDVIKDGFFRIAFARLKAKRRFAKYVKANDPKDGTAIYSYISNSLAPILPQINPEKEYDVAVSFLMPHDYVLGKVKAKKKIAWIHTDYSRIDVNSEIELPVWSAFDEIVSISPAVTRNFLKVFPSLEGKIVERQNMVPTRYVRSKADDISQEDVEREMPKVSGRFNLLSVGRFCHAKNYDNVPDICRRIRSKGMDAYWYLIGFGETEGLIRERIVEAGMEENVKILGKKENPYPFMKACDIYVQPSRYEGSPMTVLEAEALGKNVVITDFPTAGSIVDRSPLCHLVPLDNEGCASGIAALLAR